MVLMLRLVLVEQVLGGGGGGGGRGRGGAQGDVPGMCKSMDLWRDA